MNQETEAKEGTNPCIIAIIMQVPTKVEWFGMNL